MAGNNINLHGALDLSALAAARAQSAASSTVGNSTNEQTSSAYVVEVTAETFETAVLKQSLTVPVIVDLWATWCQPCKTLSPILENLARDFAGAFILAKVDVDAQQEIAAAFQVQSVPSVFAILAGQVMPLFQGAVTAAQARAAIEMVLAEAAKQGILPDAAGHAVTPPVSDPRFEAAEAAIESGDWSAAIAAYESLLAAAPADPIARIGLLNAQLFARVGDSDLTSLSEIRSTEIPELLLTLDALFLLGEYQEAFALAIEIIRQNSGDERTMVRNRLVEYFEILGADDPVVSKARIDLANALF